MMMLMGVFVVCGSAARCAGSPSLIESPHFTNETVYNDTNYHCIWVFSCHQRLAASTILQFLVFDDDGFPADCDRNFVEIREGLLTAYFSAA